MQRLLCLAMLAAVLAAHPAGAADYEAGVARIKITPATPIRMSGYASRTSESLGVIQDLYAKALALKDAQGQRVVIVTMDLIGLSGSVSDKVFARAGKQFGLKRPEMVLMVSHTHSGPVTRDNVEVMAGDVPAEKRRIAEYTDTLVDKLVEVIGAALKDLSPANLETGRGEAGFAMNRRERAAKGVKLGVNPQGPMDHEVPVLKVTTPEGKPRAVFYGYACHNTTIAGGKYGVRDFYMLCGDYAGFSQAVLEEKYPGVQAMFTIMCGGDQNPEPRGSLDMARQHGAELAGAVAKVLETKLTPVQGPIRTAVQTIELQFAPHTRKTFEDELAAAVKGARPDTYKAARAKRMLAAYDAGKPIRTIEYPIQAIRLGTGLTLLALSGEVTVEYQIRTKKEFAGENLMVIGYANDELGYIPSLNVLRGGGYEPVDSQVYYGHPGPYAENIEALMVGGIHKTLGLVGEKPAATK